MSRAEPAWREALRSWWVLLALVGWLNWTAFLYAGLRARRRRWVAYGVVYLAVSAVSLLLIALEPGEDAGPQGQVGAWMGILGWGVSFAHALGIRREFLDRIEALEDPRLDAAEDRLLRAEIARRIVEDDPRKARRLGIGRPDLRHSFDAGLVDVNHAPAQVIADLPGFDRRLAERTVEIRESINGFSSLEDFGHVVDLDGQEVERLRDVAVFLPR